jgi:hypothetical protein
MSRGAGSAYIALGVEHEPLDQTDLKNGMDAFIGGGGGTFWKLTGRGPPARSDGIGVGPFGPT